ncbi:MAG: hypothetical protein ACE5KM_15665 [Planctomycetaceae bacterium]
MEALERIDAEIVGPVHGWLQSQGDYRVLVSPDHPTLLRTKTHSHGLVPFAMCGAGVSSDVGDAFDESAARSGELSAGHDLMARLLC